nr:MAG TPA: hypothetical protein [Herelleviridae sp.]
MYCKYRISLLLMQMLSCFYLFFALALISLSKST